MKSRQLLVRAVEIVAFLFAAFGGFLKGIAPPEDAATGFSVGTASMLTLCIFLLLSAWSGKRLNQNNRRLWVVLAAALVVIAAISAVTYMHNLDRLTFSYPPENPQSVYIAGTQFTTEAATLAAAKGLNASQLVAQFGGMPYRHLVWTPPSIERGRMILVANYLLFVLSIAGAIFSLIEIRA